MVKPLSTGHVEWLHLSVLEGYAQIYQDLQCPAYLPYNHLQVIDAEMGRRRLLEDSPIASTNEDPVFFDTDQIPWWAWVKRFHLPEVSSIPGFIFLDACGCQMQAWPACASLGGLTAESIAFVEGNSKVLSASPRAQIGWDSRRPVEEGDILLAALPEGRQAVPLNMLVTRRRQRRRTAERP